MKPTMTLDIPDVGEVTVRVLAISRGHAGTLGPVNSYQDIVAPEDPWCNFEVLEPKEHDHLDFDLLEGMILEQADAKFDRLVRHRRP